MKKMNKKGFTLIEMLVVIAIIAVLVAIVIPVVGNSTEKAKEAADVANIRAAIAEVTTKALGDGVGSTKRVPMTQGTAGFANTEITSIGGITGDNLTTIANATSGTSIYVTATNAGAISVSTTAPAGYTE